MSGYVYLVRHGETYWNKQKIMHGQYDIPLDDTGIKQAQQLAQQLKNEHFDVCYCSPLERAHKTAVEILKYHQNTPVKYDARLMEINKGLLEGQRSVKEDILKSEDPYILNKYQVESKQEFLSRVSSLMAEIQDKYYNKNVLIVCHSGTVKMCMFYLNPPKGQLHEEYYKLHIKNCTYKKLPNVFPQPSSQSKIQNIHKRESEQSNMKIGIYPMVADVLHTGHITAIEEAKKHCDYLIVALHCCPNYKTPVQTIYERYMQLRAVKWVDEIIPYSNVDDARNMLLSVNFDVYFLGEDHGGKDWECSDVIKSLGKEVYYISRKHPFSSTYFKQEIIDNYKKTFTTGAEDEAVCSAR